MRMGVFSLTPPVCVMPFIYTNLLGSLLLLSLLPIKCPSCFKFYKTSPHNILFLEIACLFLILSTSAHFVSFIIKTSSLFCPCFLLLHLDDDISSASSDFFHCKEIGQYLRSCITTVIT